MKTQKQILKVLESPILIISLFLPSIVLIIGSLVLLISIMLTSNLVYQIIFIILAIVSLSFAVVLQLNTMKKIRKDNGTLKLFLENYFDKIKEEDILLYIVMYLTIYSVIIVAVIAVLFLF